MKPPLETLGPAARLEEAWQRYRRPLAVTEAHHGAPDIVDCVRWLRDVWDAAQAVRQTGADVSAVTVWSLFGSVDWRSLLLERAGLYEPGPFDVRHSPPRPTALAEAVQSLAAVGRIESAPVAGPGWWQRPERFYPSNEGSCQDLAA